MKTTLTAFSRRALALAIVTISMFGSLAAQQSFQITSLTTNDANVIEHEPITGDDRGGIALSSSGLFYSGDAATGRFPVGNISNGSTLPYQYDALVSNIRTKQMYSLGTSFGLVGYGGDVVTRLVPLDPVTGDQIAGDITLSTPIPMYQGMSQAGIFSGWDRIVLLDGDTMIAYNIDLPSGIVTPLGALNLYSDFWSPDDRCGCENWATWGVAEYSGLSIKLVYAASQFGGGFIEINGLPQGSIKRYDVVTHTVTSVADFPDGISDMCSITVDPVTNRWYFHYEGYAGAFSFGNDENIGYASATFLGPSSASAKITGRVLTAKGRGLSGVAVKAVSSDGKTTSTVTNSYGHYSLSKLTVGKTYAVSVDGRRYYFPVPTEIVTLNDNLQGLDFEALR